MRTNINIDDGLMQQALSVTGLKTKKEVVEYALTELVQRHTRKDLADLRGKIEFAEGYDYKAARENRP